MPSLLGQAGRIFNGLATSEVVNPLKFGREGVRGR